MLIKYLWEGGTRGSHESALEVLKKRYARGEISKEEFEEKKTDLI
ncbi:MAG TPA: SHOCT domain-containing protein [Candidatus Methanoperedens sp.]